MGKSQRSARSRSLAAVHAGKRALGWDDDTYRAFLFQVTGLGSAGELEDHDIGRVLDAMRQLGYKRRAGAPDHAPVPHAPSVPQLGKIAELWLELERLGALNDPSMTSLRNFGKRVTGAAAPEFMTVQQRIKLIEALKAWVRRETPRAELPAAAQPIE